MISSRLVGLARCPHCRGPLVVTDDELRCVPCGHGFPHGSPHYLDLRPREAFTENTKYLDEALHADARHESVSPPLLGSAIRQEMLRDFLRLSPEDLVLDLGCGSGRTLLWNADSGAHFVGIDVSPYFAAEAKARVDLALADLRRLPFADNTFTKACALDVLEHLSPDALRAMLAEAARVLRPGGALFVYSHVRKNARIAAGLRWINALARRLERADLIDMTQERLRKSDHLNPLDDIPHLRREVGLAGFEVSRIRYYTPIVGGFVENILVRTAEHALAKRARRRLAARETQAQQPASAGEVRVRAIRTARTSAKDAIGKRGLVFRLLKVATWAMRFDILAFGHIESGPFFALLTKRGERA